MDRNNHAVFFNFFVYIICNRLIQKVVQLTASLARAQGQYETEAEKADDVTVEMERVVTELHELKGVHQEKLAHLTHVEVS